MFFGRMDDAYSAGVVEFEYEWFLI